MIKSQRPFDLAALADAAHGIQPPPYRSSYLMIGLKGLAPGHALEKHGMQAVELNPASPG